jgi:hypothetical protein
MNAYRFALEQDKPVATFAANGTEDTSGNALITEKRQDRDAIFSTSEPDEAGYRQWLQRLSSST